MKGPPTMTSTRIRTVEYELDDHRRSTQGGVPVALTQPQLLAAVADRAELPKADAKRVLDALEAVVLDELSHAQKVRISGIVQLTSNPPRRSAKAATPPPGSRSRSRLALTSGPGRWPAPSRRCRRCKRHAADSPPDEPTNTGLGKARHRRARPPHPAQDGPVLRSVSPGALADGSRPRIALLGRTARVFGYG